VARIFDLRESAAPFFEIKEYRAAPGVKVAPETQRRLDKRASFINSRQTTLFGALRPRIKAVAPYRRVGFFAPCQTSALPPRHTVHFSRESRLPSSLRPVITPGGSPSRPAAPAPYRARGAAPGFLPLGRRRRHSWLCTPRTDAHGAGRGASSGVRQVGMDHEDRRGTGHATSSWSVALWEIGRVFAKRRSVHIPARRWRCGGRSAGVGVFAVRPGPHPGKVADRAAILLRRTPGVSQSNGLDTAD